LRLVDAVTETEILSGLFDLLSIPPIGRIARRHD